MSDFEVEWARCSPWLEAALSHGQVRTHDLQHVLTAVETGEAMFWPGRRSAAVTQVEVLPLVTAGSVWLAGGDLDELRGVLLPRFEQWARENGCDCVSVTGRQGWGRALGYAPVHWTCAKEL